MRAKARLHNKQRPTKSRRLPLYLAISVVGLLALVVPWTLSRHVEKSQSRSERLSPRKINIDRPKLIQDVVAGEISAAATLLKIPTPIFVTSLPKSGTTPTWKYFLCGLGKGQAAHQHANIHNGTEQIRLGKCLKDNISNKRDFLEGCGDYKVWTDAGVLAPGTCFYPSIHGGLRALYDSYPTATILQVNRETESWVNSTTEFNDLWTRWSEKCDKFPGVESTREDYAKFYESHTEMVRQFAKDHPSMTYIEVSLEGADTGTVLEEKTGINASCWVHSRTKKGRRARPHVKKQNKEHSK